MTTKWLKFLALPAWERRFIVRSALCLPAIWLALRLRGVNSMLAWASSPSVSRRGGRINDASCTIKEARRRAQLTSRVASVLLPSGSCVPQSIFLCRSLIKAGLNARIEIGSRLEHGRFSAHSWVNIDGVSLDPTAGEYKPFFTPTPTDPESAG